MAKQFRVICIHRDCNFTWEGGYHYPAVLSGHSSAKLSEPADTFINMTPCGVFGFGTAFECEAGG